MGSSLASFIVRFRGSGHVHTVPSPLLSSHFCVQGFSYFLFHLIPDSLAPDSKQTTL